MKFLFSSTDSRENQQPQQPDHILTSPPQSRAQPLSSDCFSDEPVAVLQLSPGASAGPSCRAVTNCDLHCEFCAVPLTFSRSVSCSGQPHFITTCGLCQPQAASAASCAGHHHVEPSIVSAEPWTVHGWFARPVGVGMGLEVGSLQPACQDLCCACCQVPLVLRDSCFAPSLPPLCQQCYPCQVLYSRLLHGAFLDPYVPSGQPVHRFLDYRLQAGGVNDRLVSRNACVRLLSGTFWQCFGRAFDLILIPSPNPCASLRFEGPNPNLQSAVQYPSQDETTAMQASMPQAGRPCGAGGPRCMPSDPSSSPLGALGFRPDPAVLPPLLLGTVALGPSSPLSVGIGFRPDSAVQPPLVQGTVSDSVFSGLWPQAAESLNNVNASCVASSLRAHRAGAEADCDVEFLNFEGQDRLSCILPSLRPDWQCFRQHAFSFLDPNPCLSLPSEGPNPNFSLGPGKPLPSFPLGEGPEMCLGCDVNPPLAALGHVSANAFISACQEVYLANPCDSLCAALHDVSQFCHDCLVKWANQPAYAGSGARSIISGPRYFPLDGDGHASASDLPEPCANRVLPTCPFRSLGLSPFRSLAPARPRGQDGCTDADLSRDLTGSPKSRRTRRRRNRKLRREAMNEAGQACASFSSNLIEPLHLWQGAPKTPEVEVLSKRWNFAQEEVGRWPWGLGGPCGSGPATGGVSWGAEGEQAETLHVTSESPTLHNPRAAQLEADLAVPGCVSSMPTCSFSATSADPTLPFATAACPEGVSRHQSFAVHVECFANARHRRTAARKRLYSRTSKTDAITTAPVDWHHFLELLEIASDSGFEGVESLLLDLVEVIEGHFKEDTLEWWVGFTTMECITDCADPAWVKAAVQQLIHASVRDPPKPVRIVALNITTWGPKFKDWLSGQPHPFDILCVQETHLLKQVPSAGAWLSSRGLVGHFGPGHKTTAKGVKGGLVTISASHRNVCQSIIFQQEGCGFLVDFIRLSGWTLAVLNLYLQTGTSLQSDPNCTILARLLTCVRELSVPWVVVGDFNIPLAELQATSIPTEAQGVLVSPGGPTTDDGACLDYALACHSLAGSLAAKILWDAPFRPHALVEFSLLAGCTLPLPQLPFFRQLIGGPSHPFSPCASPRSPVWDGCSVPSNATCAYAAWSQAAAACFGVLEHVPGMSFTIEVKPLVGSRPERVWRGQSESFWDRVSAWAKKLCGFKGRTATAETAFLAEVEAHWVAQDDFSCEDWKLQGSQFLQGSRPSQAWFQATAHQQKLARAAHLASKSETYQTWLKSSMLKGMRPLFRALSNPEANVERPFREFGLELRPFLRLQFWAGLWKARPSPLPPLESSLHNRAREHAMSLKPLTLADLQPRLSKLSNKAGGADGWSYAQLKLLPQEALESLLLLFRAIECDGLLPEQWLTSLVTMLPKNNRVERPIALCNATYRLWAKLRYPEVESWVKSFQQTAPWEQAVPGQSTLDVSITRLLQAEIARSRKLSRIVLFVDLQTFYESIAHTAIAEQVLQHNFPAVCADTALKIYRGARYIAAESTVSPRCYAESGLMAGCPYAPALAKLALFPSLSKLSSSNLTSNITAWLDDVSVDTEGPVAATTAAKAVKSFHLLKQSLSLDGLKMSLTKTCFVCTDAPSEKALKKLLSPEDPPVTPLARDLGTDYSGSRRRRITIARARQDKGRSRSGRLRQLRIPSLTHKWRVFKGGVFATAAWGHQAQGLAPKRLKWLRGCAAQQLNRHKLGSSDLVFDLHSTHEDPLITVLSQHFTTIARIFLRWPSSLWPQLKTSWQVTCNRLQATPHPWKVVSGPLAAAQAYLFQLQVHCQSLEQWRFDSHVMNCQWQDPGFKTKLLSAVKSQALNQRNSRISQFLDDPQLSLGLDWTSHRARLKRLNKLNRPTKWLQALWQGAVLFAGNGGLEICPLCKVPASWRHVLLDCTYWRTRHKQLPGHWRDLQTKWPSKTLWERGLLPAEFVKQPRPRWSESEFREGLWTENQKLNGQSYVFSTDATGGPDSVDVRLRIVAFAVLAFTKDGDHIHPVASITGFLPNGASVADGETRALQVLAENVSGYADATVDCQTAIKRARKFGKNLQCHWVRSHQSVDCFRQEFGAANMWRHAANDHADKLCEKTALRLYDKEFSASVRFLDHLVQEVATFLSERVEILITSKSDPPPQAFYERRGTTCKSHVVSPSASFAKPHRAASQAVRTPTSQPTEGGPNKKQRLQQLLADPSLQLGHTWQAKETKAVNNFAVTCTTCQLYIEQVSAPNIFTRKINHPCKDIPAALPGCWVIHDSHSMVNKGAFFACVTCLSVVKLGALATSKVLQAPCRGWARKKGGIDNVLKTKTCEQVAVQENQSEVPPSSSRAPEVPTTAGDGFLP